jgi:hypothetical protein
MFVSASTAWKLILGLALLGTIVLSARARAPRRAMAGTDLRRLVVSALLLYVVGAVAWMAHHLALAVLVYAAGISTAALAAWLSRGDDSEEPPSDADPVDEQPPPDPGGLHVDWEVFEREMRDYTERSRTPAGVCD